MYTSIDVDFQIWCDVIRCDVTMINSIIILLKSIGFGGSSSDGGGGATTSRAMRFGVPIWWYFGARSPLLCGCPNWLAPPMSVFVRLSHDDGRLPGAQAGHGASTGAMNGPQCGRRRPKERKKRRKKKKRDTDSTASVPRTDRQPVGSFDRTFQNPGPS